MVYNKVIFVWKMQDKKKGKKKKKKRRKRKKKKVNVVGEWMRIVDVKERERESKREQMGRKMRDFFECV